MAKTKAQGKAEMSNWRRGSKPGVKSWHAASMKSEGKKQIKGKG